MRLGTHPNVKAVNYRNVVVDVGSDGYWYWCTYSEFVNAFGANPDTALVTITNGDSNAASFRATLASNGSSVFVSFDRASIRCRIFIKVVTFY